jgi:hypothetical protein
MSRQRSLQNGRNGEDDQSIWRLQVGHLTRAGLKVVAKIVGTVAGLQIVDRRS